MVEKKILVRCNKGHESYKTFEEIKNTTRCYKCRHKSDPRSERTPEQLEEARVRRADKKRALAEEARLMLLKIENEKANEERLRLEKIQNDKERRRLNNLAIRSGKMPNRKKKT